MFKFVALIPRKEDVTREFFGAYYESNHAPLALKYFRGFKKYLRNHIVEELEGSAPTFDVFSEFWYESIEELMKTGRFMESDNAPIILHDENQFMYKAGVVSFAVEEHIVSGPERCLEPNVSKVVLAIKRSKGAELSTFNEALLKKLVGLTDAWNLSRLSCSVVQHNDETEADWDAFVFAWPKDSSVAVSLPAEFNDGWQDYMLLRTDSTETDLKRAYSEVPAEEGATSAINV